jgi:hypothetical protein
MNLGAHYTLANDVLMGDPLNQVGGMWSKRGFVPVGSLSRPFTGTLDGLDHVVDALAIKPRVWKFIPPFVLPVPAGNVGLFGVNSGTIRNITLSNADVDGASNVGALVGYNKLGGTVFRASSSGSIVGGVSVGGLVGKNAGKVTRSGTVATVSGTNRVGGLVGDNSGAISNAFAAGKVSGSANVGGLVGMNTGKIAIAYAAATVGGGAANPGALVGFNDGGAISNSYWDTDVTGLMKGIGGSSGGSSNATGHTTLWLSDPLNYPLTWDMRNIWYIPGGQLPQLR